MADLLGIQKLTQGNSFGVVCPFCGDKRAKMNFRIFKDGIPANTYHCYCCGAHGNMLTLYADQKGIYGTDRYKIAYREIKEALRLPGNQKISDIQAPASFSEEEPADLQVRDQVYRRLLMMLTLSQTHEKKLMERGLTEKQIKKHQFKSTPPYGTESLTRKLIQEGYSLAGIPGFFVNDRKNWDIAFYRKNRGFLCPAYSIDGKIAGFQIRLDEPYEDRKYLWLSSTNKNRGTSSKSPVIFLGNPHERIVRVTEGILKATVAHALSGYNFLGVPGVNQYKELEKSLILLMQNGLEEVQELYDMDKYLDIRCYADYKESVCKSCSMCGQFYGIDVCEKKKKKRDQIREGCNRLYEICKKLDLPCTRKRWDYRPDGIWAGNDKGIDDYWLSCIKDRKEAGWKDGSDRGTYDSGGLPKDQERDYGG